MACVHHHEYYDNNFTEFCEFAEYAYRGALLLKSERMEINAPNANTDPDSQKRFEKRKRIERYAIFDSIVECRLAKGKAVGPHLEKMSGFFQSLEKLGFPISQELSIGIILGTLPQEYDSFIKNFYLCHFNKTLNQLHQMLKTFEIDIIRKPKNTTNNCKLQIKNPQPKSAAKTHDLCNYCNQLGHWKRNCKTYLEDRKKGDLNLL